MFEVAYAGCRQAALGLADHVETATILKRACRIELKSVTYVALVFTVSVALSLVLTNMRSRGQPLPSFIAEPLYANRHHWSI